MLEDSSMFLLVIWFMQLLLGVEMQTFHNKHSETCSLRKWPIMQPGLVNESQNSVSTQKVRSIVYNDPNYDEYENENDLVKLLTEAPALPEYLEIICSNSKSIYNSLISCGTCQKITFRESNISVIHTNTYQGAALLEELELSGLGVEKLESGAFGYLPNLKTINLDRNNLKKISRGVFNSLPNLIYLNLSYNAISNLEEESFHGSPNIKQIDLSYNRIRVIPEDMFQHSGLSYLNLSNNLLSTLGNDFCQSLPSLNHLVLDKNLFTEIPELSKCSISHLSFGSNQIDSFNCTYLPKHIRELSIENNGIEEITGECCMYFESLKKLDISHNNLQITDQACFKHLKNLEFLDISDTQMLDINPELFFDKNHLKEIRLSNNNITFIQKGVFRDLNRLHHLDLSRNGIGVLESGALNSLESLEVLNVSHNKLEYLQSGVFNDLKLVVVMDLSFNNLEFLALHIFNPLRNLKALNLNFNRLKNLEMNIPFVPSEFLIDLDGNNFNCGILAKLIRDIQFRGIVINKGQTISSENIDGISCHDNAFEELKVGENDIVMEMKNFYQNDFKNTTFYNFFKNFLVNGGKDRDQYRISKTAEEIYNNLTNGLSEGFKAHVGEFLKFENKSFQHFLKELSAIVGQLEAFKKNNETSAFERLSLSFKKEIETFANFENSSFQNFMSKLSEIAERMKENRENSWNIPEMFEKLNKINAEKWVTSKQSNDSSELVKAINQFKVFCMLSVFIVLVMLVSLKIWPYVRVKYLRENPSNEYNQDIVLS